MHILVSAVGHPKTIVPAYEGIRLPVIGLGVFDVSKVIVSSPKINVASADHATP